MFITIMAKVDTVTIRKYNDNLKQLCCTQCSDSEMSIQSEAPTFWLQVVCRVNKITITQSLHCRLMRVYNVLIIKGKLGIVLSLKFAPCSSAQGLPQLSEVKHLSGV